MIFWFSRSSACSSSAAAAADSGVSSICISRITTDSSFIGGKENEKERPEPILDTTRRNFTF